MHKIRVPATSANLGPGFDSLGIAFNLYNTFTFEEIPKGLEIVGCDEYYNNEDNLIYLSMKKALADMDHRISGVRITVDSDIPISSGLGSSAACIVAGILGANELAGRPFSKDDMLRTATNIEGHPDNVAPALFGGMISSVYDEKVYYSKVNIVKGLKFLALVPDFKLSTKKSRSVLPKVVPHNDATFNVSRVALMITALQNGEFDLLKVAGQDKLHEQYRGSLINGYDTIVSECKKTDAKGIFLSGAGPTILLAIKEDDSKTYSKVRCILDSLNDNWDIKELDIDYEGVISKKL